LQINYKSLITTSDIFTITNQKQFEKIALKVFRFQYDSNDVYREFCQLLNVEKKEVKSLQQIPFLSIQFFKSNVVIYNNNPVK